jgi:hypothetical protein
LKTAKLKGASVLHPRQQQRASQQQKFQQQQGYRHQYHQRAPQQALPKYASGNHSRPVHLQACKKQEVQELLSSLKLLSKCSSNSSYKGQLMYKWV